MVPYLSIYLDLTQSTPVHLYSCVKVNCGSVFDRAGMPNDAIMLYEYALAIDDRNPYLLNNIGWLLETHRGDLQGAIKKYSLAVDLLKPKTNPQIEANVRNLHARLTAMKGAASDGSNTTRMT